MHWKHKKRYMKYSDYDEHDSDFTATHFTALIAYLFGLCLLIIFVGSLLD